MRFGTSGAIRRIAPDMQELFDQIAGYVSLYLDVVAVLLVAVGGIFALAEILRAIARRQEASTRLRAIFIDFARWLVAALTFQLGADIVGTTIAPSWDQLGRLATVAAIRTFLTYFLDRDLEKAREEQHLDAHEK